MPKFIVTVRSISGDAFTGGLGAIRYLSVPDGAAPTPAHQVARTAWIKQVMQTFVRDASGNATGDLLFLVHGFNTDFTNANALHDVVTAGLAGKLVCTIVSFDWPSAAETFAYLEDLDTAKRTAVDLVNAAIRPLIAAQTDDCQVAVHVACHSMGAYVAREAFDHADDGPRRGPIGPSISSCLSLDAPSPRRCEVGLRRVGERRRMTFDGRAPRATAERREGDRPGKATNAPPPTTKPGIVERHKLAIGNHIRPSSDSICGYGKGAAPVGYYRKPPQSVQPNLPANWAAGLRQVTSRPNSIWAVLPISKCVFRASASASIGRLLPTIARAVAARPLILHQARRATGTARNS